MILGTLLIIVGAMAIVFHKHERDYEKTFEARMLAAEKEGYKKALELIRKEEANNKVLEKCPSLDEMLEKATSREIQKAILGDKVFTEISTEIEKKFTEFSSQ